MNNEAISYRFALLVAVCGFVAYGAIFSLNVIGHFNMKSAWAEYERLKAECAKTPAWECDRPTSDFEAAYKGVSEDRESHLVEWRESNKNDLIENGFLAIACPLGALLTFYLVRWLLTGRVRPFRVK